MRLRDFLPSRHDVVLGHRYPPLARPLVRLRPEDQAYHATIWGRTGSGKSRLLQSLFMQHLCAGRGVAIIEPHHDLSFQTLASLVESGFFRQKGAFEKLVYLDWGNGSLFPSMS